MAKIKTVQEDKIVKEEVIKTPIPQDKPNTSEAPVEAHKDPSLEASAVNKAMKPKTGTVKKEKYRAKTGISFNRQSYLEGETIMLTGVEYESIKNYVE